MTLLGNWTLAPLTTLEGSKIDCFPHGPSPLEKSPASSAAVGTVVNPGAEKSSMNRSQLAKKKVLFLKIGPPTAPPNVLRSTGGFARPTLLLKKLFAFSPSLLRYSQALPWNW